MKTETTSEPIEIEEADIAVSPEPRRSLATVAGLVRGVDVELTNAAVGAILAADDVRMERAGARTVFVGGELDLRQGGAGLIVAGGDTHVTQGGAQAIVSAGSVTMEQAGSGFAIGRKVRIGRGGMTIFAVAPRVEADAEARVVVGPPASLALAAAILGLAAAAILRLRRGR